MIASDIGLLQEQKKSIVSRVGRTRHCKHLH